MMTTTVDGLYEDRQTKYAESADKRTLDTESNLTEPGCFIYVCTA